MKKNEALVVSNPSLERMEDYMGYICLITLSPKVMGRWLSLISHLKVLFLETAAYEGTHQWNADQSHVSG